MLAQAKSKLNKKGKILILTLQTKNNNIPCFTKMGIKLNKSLKKDEAIFKIIKKNFIKYQESYFKHKVNISKKKYLMMIKERYISCLLNIKSTELRLGIKEINNKFADRMKFDDILRCLIYRK